MSVKFFEVGGVRLFDERRYATVLQNFEKAQAIASLLPGGIWKVRPCDYDFRIKFGCECENDLGFINFYVDFPDSSSTRKAYREFIVVCNSIKINKNKSNETVARELQRRLISKLRPRKALELDEV